MGWSYDKIGFKPIFYILMGINLFITAVSYFSKLNEYTYFFTIILSHFVNNSIFTLFPVPVAKTFGKKYGIQVYAIVMVAWSFNSITNVFLIKVISENDPHYGNLVVYMICLVFTIIAIGMNYIFIEELDIEHMEKKGKIILADQ